MTDKEGGIIIAMFGLFLITVVGVAGIYFVSDYHKKEHKECKEHLKAFKFERIGLKEDILILEQSIYKLKERE